MDIQKLDFSSKICCPHCGRPTRSLKYYNIVTKRVCFIYYHERTTNTLVGCPKCMNLQNIWRTFNDNIIRANIIWPFLHLPLALIILIRSNTPGHSTETKYYIEQYNRNPINSISKIYHNWNGIPCISPPFTLLLKIETKRAITMAINSKSFVWLIKAWCYINRQNFYISFNGRAIALGDDAISPEFVAFDNDKTSELYYRDFIVIPQEYGHIYQKTLEHLNNIKDELGLINEKDNQGSIHIHAQCLYDVNFADNPIGKLNWIIERVSSHRNEVLKWFNNAKIGAL